MQEIYIGGMGVEKIIFNGSLIDNAHLDNGVLTVSTSLSPHIIDENFNELESRDNMLESEIQELKHIITKLEHKVNILEVINKHG